MKKIIYILLISLFFIGCENETSNTINIIELEIDKLYTVNEGDKLKKTSDDAEVTITKNIQTNITTVILTKGSATITQAK